MLIKILRTQQQAMSSIHKTYYYLCRIMDSKQHLQNLKDFVDQLRTQVDEFTITDSQSLEKYRIHFLGVKGLVKIAMGSVKNIAPEDRKMSGIILNDFKLYAETKYFEAANEKIVQAEATSTTNKQDQTLPAATTRIGARHPLSITMNKMLKVFEKIGFTVAEGPEIEDDWHNFTALNLPEHHPARDMQDTFYISKDPDWVLRTHTSSVQVRVMKDGKLPIRQVFPGRVYRNETVSARAHCFFHQIEGLYIDDNVSFADLKQTLYYFVQQMFGQDVKVRFRPSYFPFTEPSAEMDVSCFICDSKGCNVCKHTGWVEILGCGMVHPNVLDNSGIDSKKYTGFAWGMGVERMTMMLYGIKDIRLLSENDVRFLDQFVAG
jgi:phenylalanyl-tRNA synthetase alpha chain